MPDTRSGYYIGQRGDSQSHFGRLTPPAAREAKKPSPGAPGLGFGCHRAALEKRRSYAASRRRRQTIATASIAAYSAKVQYRTWTIRPV